MYFVTYDKNDWNTDIRCPLSRSSCVYTVFMLPIFLMYINLDIKLCISFCATPHLLHLLKESMYKCLSNVDFPEICTRQTKLGFTSHNPRNTLSSLTDALVLQRPLDHIVTRGKQWEHFHFPFTQTKWQQSPPPSFIHLSTFVFQSELLTQFKLVSFYSSEQFR